MATAERRTSPDGLTEPELLAWHGMLRVHAALTKALDAQLEAEHGLALSSYEVLHFLAEAPGQKLRMSELAEKILLSRSGLTRLVDRLERDGLLCRQSCDHDARGAFAKLTSTTSRRGSSRPSARSGRACCPAPRPQRAAARSSEQPESGLERSDAKRIRSLTNEDSGRIMRVHRPYPFRRSPHGTRTLGAGP